MEVTPSESKPFNPLEKWLNLNQKEVVWDNFKSTVQTNCRQKGLAENKIAWTEI